MEFSIRTEAILYSVLRTILKIIFEMSKIVVFSMLWMLEKSIKWRINAIKNCNSSKPVLGQTG